MITAAIEIVEDDWRPLSTNPNASPSSGGAVSIPRWAATRTGRRRAWPSCGSSIWPMVGIPLLDIAERAKLPFAVVAEAARLLGRAACWSRPRLVATERRWPL